MHHKMVERRAQGQCSRSPELREYVGDAHSSLHDKLKVAMPGMRKTLKQVAEEGGHVTHSQIEQTHDALLALFNKLKDVC